MKVKPLHTDSSQPVLPAGSSGNSSQQGQGDTLPHDSQLTPLKPPQVVKRLATIMPSAAIYTHLRTDFTGTVAAMAELAANPDVPRIDIPSEVFSSALLKCMCNEIQTYLFNKEFGYYDQAEEAAKESKLTSYGITVDVSTGKVYHNINQVDEFVGRSTPGKGCKLYFAGRVNNIKAALDKCYVVALVRVVASSDSRSNVLMCLPVVVHSDYFGQVSTDNKDSCSILSWMCRQVASGQLRTIATLVLFL